MSTALGIIILAEVALTLFTAWGIMNEKRFVRCERRVAAAVKANLLYFSKKRAAAQHRRVNARVLYTPLRANSPHDASRAA